MLARGLAEGGGGGTGNVHVHKKEDKRRNNANDRRRNSRNRNATLAVRDACTPDMDTAAAAAGAWRGVVESNTRTQLNEFMLFKLQQLQHSCSSSGAILQV